MPSNFQQILQFTSQGKGTFEKTEGIKVICVGQSRTGTSSLKAALSILLPGVTYHGMDFLNEINNKETFDFWTGLREGTVDKNMIRSYFKYRQFDSILEWVKIWDNLCYSVSPLKIVWWISFYL